MKRSLSWGLLVMALVLLYSVSLGHNFLFDEENVILRNPTIKSLSNIPHVFQSGFFYLGGSGAAPFLEYYRPLSVLSFMADYHFWGTDPMGYNLTSLLVHILLALAFFELLVFCLKSIPAAFLAALLFAIHPIHTEAINQVSCRSETFGALFLVLALLLYLRDKRWWVPLFQIAALLSKESAVLVPIFLLAADIVVLKGKALDRVKRIAPFVAISVLYVLYRKYACPIPMHIESEALEPRLQRVLSMAPALIHYFKTLIWPPYFQLFGSIEFAKGFWNAQVGWTVCLYGIALWSLWDAWKRKAVSFVGLALLFVGFAPYLQTVAFYPQWAEHFLTIPALGFYFLLAIVFRSIFNIQNKKLRVAILVLPCIWAVCLGYRTYERNELYNDLDRYYAVLSKSNSPYAVHGLQGLAKIRMAEGDNTGAIKYLEEALTKDLNQDVTHIFLGWCEANEGRYEKALEHFDSAITLNPDVMSYQKDRANILMSLKRYADASAVYAALIVRSPQDFTLYRAAIAALELDGHEDRALTLGQVALRLFEQRKFESAVLRMSLIRLSYRHAWTDTLNENLSFALNNYPDVPWQGKVAELLSGRLTAEEFSRNVLPQFAGFEDEAKMLYLMSFVLKKDKPLLIEYLGSHKAFFEEKASRDPLFAKEWQVAKDAAV